MKKLTHCFSLTMWYVNILKGALLECDNGRFSLTMWYVNLRWSSSIILIVLGFFINYVVCK